MSVPVVHRWRSGEPKQLFDCGREVKRHMRWDIRALTGNVLAEHERSGAFGGGRVRACRQCRAKKKGNSPYRTKHEVKIVYRTDGAKAIEIDLGGGLVIEMLNEQARSMGERLLRAVNDSDARSAALPEGK